MILRKVDEVNTTKGNVDKWTLYEYVVCEDTITS